MKQVIIDSEGKLCRPIYPECLFVDSTPRKGSMNPISSDAVFNAVGGATDLPSYDESNEGQILKVKDDASGVEWADAPESYPSVTGNAGKVLTVNSGATGVEWTNASGGGDIVVIPLTAAPTGSALETLFNQVDTAVSADKQVVIKTTNSSNKVRYFALTNTNALMPMGKFYHFNCIELVENGPAADAIDHWMVVSFFHDGSDPHYNFTVSDFTIASNLTSSSFDPFSAYLEPVGARTLRFRFLGIRAQPSSTVTVPMPVTLSFLQSCQEYNSVGAVWTQVSENVFDWHYNDTAWGASSASNVPLYKDTLIKKGSSRDSILKYYYFDIVEGDFSGVTTIANLFRDDNPVHIAALRNMSSIEDAQYAFCAVGQADRQSLLHIDNLDMPSLTNAQAMFMYNSKLTSAPLVTTSNCTTLRQMFSGCSSITSVPLYNTDSASDTRQMFNNCTAVESGALALYSQASTQATPPTTHTDMFYNCGFETVSGRAELDQIPSSWGGTGS